MSYTFAKSAGISIGSSIFDEKGAKEVPLILEDAKKYNVEVILPLDIVICEWKDTNVLLITIIHFILTNLISTFIADNFSNDAKVLNHFF